MLGEFEYLILTVAATLDEDAYGAAIRAQIEQKTGRRCSIGALYTTIERLEAKGLLKTWMGDATPQRWRPRQTHGARHPERHTRRKRIPRSHYKDQHRRRLGLASPRS
jgi:DNA-binding PadR family transcriptional regulator